MSAPVEVPGDIIERVRAMCLELPEVTVRTDRSLTGARSTAQSFDIRRRSFCLLVAVEGHTGRLGGDPCELVTESYRLLAPKKLTALLDGL